LPEVIDVDLLLQLLERYLVLQSDVVRVEDTDTLVGVNLLKVSLHEVEPQRDEVVELISWGELILLLEPKRVRKVHVMEKSSFLINRLLFLLLLLHFHLLITKLLFIEHVLFFSRFVFYFHWGCCVNKLWLFDFGFFLGGWVVEVAVIVLAVQVEEQI
jgi:hypothetical protein